MSAILSNIILLIVIPPSVNLLRVILLNVLLLDAILLGVIIITDILLNISLSGISAEFHFNVFLLCVILQSLY
jgi:hypothetical protein